MAVSRREAADCRVRNPSNRTRARADTAEPLPARIRSRARGPPDRYLALRLLRRDGCGRDAKNAVRCHRDRLRRTELPKIQIARIQQPFGKPPPEVSPTTRRAILLVFGAGRENVLISIHL